MRISVATKRFQDRLQEVSLLGSLTSAIGAMLPVVALTRLLRPAQLLCPFPSVPRPLLRWWRRFRLLLPRLLKEHHDRGGVVGDALTLELPPGVGLSRQPLARLPPDTRSASARFETTFLNQNSAWNLTDSASSSCDTMSTAS